MLVRTPHAGITFVIVSAMPNMNERNRGFPLFTAPGTPGIPARYWMDARWVLAQCDWSASVFTHDASMVLLSMVCHESHQD